MADLERELETYNRELQTLVGKEGKYVLIKGDKVIDTYDAYADALQAGYKQFGVTPFLVKQIASPQQISYFTRDLGTECRA